PRLARPPQGQGARALRRDCGRRRGRPPHLGVRAPPQGAVTMRVRLFALVLLSLPSADVPAEESRPVGEPAAYVFRAPGGVELKAYAFSSPSKEGRAQRPAIVVFH